MDTTYKNILPNVTPFSDIAGPILERKDMHAIFQKKGKRAKYFKIWAKMYKIRKYFEKGSLICATVPHMKQLEYALHSQIIHNHHI